MLNQPLASMTPVAEFKLDAAVRPLARRLHANHMSALGIANTMRLAHAYNRLKFGRQDSLAPVPLSRPTSRTHKGERTAHSSGHSH